MAQANTGATALTLDGGTLRYTGVAMTSTNFNRKIRLNAGGGTLELASTGIGWIAGAGTTSVITGPGSFTKTGTQQLIVSGFTDYDGITFINAGELQMRDSARGLGSTVGKTVVASGAQLATGGGGSLGAIFENIDLNGTGSSGGGALQCNDGPTATFAGTITLVTDSAIGGGSPAALICWPVSILLKVPSAVKMPVRMPAPTAASSLPMPISTRMPAQMMTASTSMTPTFSNLNISRSSCTP